MATYKVQGGDTLSGIAAKYGTDYKKITGYKSGDPNKIFPGEVLTIPDAGNPIAPPAQFGDKGGVQSYTNAAQNNFIQSYQPPDVPKVSSAADIVGEVKKLLPTNPAPEAPKLTDLYAKYRTENHLDQLESDINDLTAQEDAIVAERRQRNTLEQGKPVDQNVIAGRMSEVDRQESEKLDYITRLKARKVDELTSRQQTIQTMMSLTQTDYQNAKGSYDSQFSQALSIIETVRGIRKDQIDENQKAMDNARANLTVYANALKDGSIDLNNMAPDQRAQLNKLELQSGFPIGFLSSIKKDPKADIVSTTSNNGQIQVLLRNPDGTMALKSYGTPSTAGGSDLFHLPGSTQTSSSGWKVVPATTAQPNSSKAPSPQPAAKPNPTPAPAPSANKSIAPNASRIQPISNLW